MPVDVLKLSSYSARVTREAEADGRTIAAAIALSDRATERVEQWMQAGLHDVVITARGGGAVRARLYIAPPQFTEQSIPTLRLSINWATGTIARGASRVALSRTELRLLSALVDADGALVSRRVLVAAAWPHERLSERDSHLTVYMCLLRKRFSTIGIGGALRTERGTGYRLHL